MNRVSRRHAGWTVPILAALVLGAACDRAQPERVRSPETRAVEARAGDFLEYYEHVLRLAKEHATEPDSFRVALDALPGSHLSDEEWQAWVAPYTDDPVAFADRVESVLADLAGS
jgi:hypothetical protein